MASTIDDDYNNLKRPKLGSASSQLQTVSHSEPSHLHSPAPSPPGLRQPISPNALESPSIVARNAHGLLREAAPLPSSVSYDIPPNYSQSLEYLTGTLNSNINESGRNAIGNFTAVREQSENASEANFGDVSYSLTSNKHYLDPVSPPCLAAFGLECYCPGCESGRADIASTTTANFRIEPNNFAPINSGNTFSGLTAKHSTQFATGIPSAGPNTDYYSNGLSTFLPESQHNPIYTSLEISGEPILRSTATAPLQKVPWKAGQFADILEQPNIQFTSSTGPPTFETRSYPPLSSHTTELWNPNNTAWIASKTWDDTDRDSLRSMGHYSDWRLWQTQSQPTTDQPHSHVPRKRGHLKSLTSNISRSEEHQNFPAQITPACVEFLKVQEYLNVEMKSNTNVTDSWKKNLAKLLKISTVQLETYIKAREVIGPKIEDLAAASEDLGIPAEHVAAWFLQAAPRKSSRDVMNDSAYQSNPNNSQERTRPAKRLKKTSGDEASSKPYQCTFIDHDKSYCLQSSKDYGDWKRHEEKHYPQKRWVCLIQGSVEGRSCYVCSGRIDLVEEPVTVTHTACLTRPARQGHTFLRRDKLLAHVRSEHKCEASIGTWYQNVSGNWKRQCGFCGEIFSEWEERCRHVGQHFQKNKRMIPDWKDPWPLASGNSDQRPDDDSENNDNGGMDDNGGGDSRNGEKSSPAPKSNSESNGRGDGQRRNNGNEPGNSSNNQGGRRRHSNGKDQSDQSDQLDLQNRNLRAMISGQSIAANEQFQYSELLPSPYEINLPFRSIRKLGYGAFGTVDEIVHPPSNTRFARKTIRNSSKDPSLVFRQVRREIDCLRQLNHEHIIKVMASYIAEDQISIIMSPIADCNLWEFMRSPSKTATQMSHLSKWFGCLASALSYLHSKSWLHMDLKPQNILISGDRALLSDFGSAFSVAKHDMGETAGMRYAITPMYCAPELITRGVSEAATRASDIYSLGCIYLEMATGIFRQSVSRFEDLRSFGSGDKSFSRNALKCVYWIDGLWERCEEMSLGVRHKDFQVIRSMLSFDVMKRPTAHSLEEFYSKDYYCKEESRAGADYYVIKLADQPFFDLMVVASTWIRTCDMYHKHCSHGVVDFFPTRILNVGMEGDTIRLQSTLHELSSPYVTLTHCWGAGNILKTTSQTLNERSLGIESSLLSNTFQNAVKITRALGFNYLWIDSLCIVQDSPEDWAKVASQMHKIYSNSYLTISILNEEDSSTTLSRGPAIKKLTGADPCKHECRAFQPLLEDTASTMILNNPISKRAWTLQERVLSPRVLHFSSTRLAWECGSGTSIFDSVSIIRNSMGIGQRVLSSHFLEGRNLCLPTLQPPSTPQVRKLWRDIVREYSQRQLTRPSDKLTALAGLAAKISALGAGKYLAGLWNDDLKHSLLWSRDLSTPPSVRPPYRAPSWSWAAIDSRVMWSKSVTDLPDDCKTTILRCSTTLCSKLSPFGAVLDGYLKISGPMRKVVVHHPYVEELLEVISSKPVAFAQWDASTIPPRTRHVQHGKAYLIEELWCLQILHGTGLLLKERSDCEDTFERVGIYWTGADAHNEEDGERFSKRRTITIV